MADLADEDDRVALPLQNVLLGVVLLNVERHRLVIGLGSQSSMLNAHTLSRPQGVVRGGSGLPNFWNNEKKCGLYKPTIKVCVSCS